MELFSVYQLLQIILQSNNTPKRHFHHLFVDILAIKSKQLIFYKANAAVGGISTGTDVLFLLILCLNGTHRKRNSKISALWKKSRVLGYLLIPFLLCCSIILPFHPYKKQHFILELKLEIDIQRPKTKNFPEHVTFIKHMLITNSKDWFWFCGSYQTWLSPRLSKHSGVEVKTHFFFFRSEITRMRRESTLLSVLTCGSMLWLICDYRRRKMTMIEPGSCEHKTTPLAGCS